MAKKTKTRSIHQPKTVLLIIDMLNALDFPQGKSLLSGALRAARRIQALKRKAKEHGAPVIYINDNFGDWHSDWKEVYEECTKPGVLGKPLAEMLKPEPGDYFVLKPKHSAFYLTPLELLLEDLGAKRLVLTGIAGNLCVLFTAHDAHMREYEVEVPRDCVASNTAAQNQAALKQLKEVLGLKTPLSKNAKF